MGIYKMDNRDAAKTDMIGKEYGLTTIMYYSIKMSVQVDPKIPKAQKCPPMHS